MLRWSIRYSAFLIVGAVTACAPPTWGEAVTVPGHAAARLEVREARGGRMVPPGLFGSNVQWEHRGDGVLSAEEARLGAWHPGVLAAMRTARLTSLRFPGGSLANTYRWRTGIGPRSGRAPGLSFAGELVPSDFGTDEFIRLCRDAQTAGVVTVNLSAGPEEAAEWVAYLNGARQNAAGQERARNGNRKALDVRYWEIGNELYSPSESGHLSAADYGQRVRSFARAMKAVDPSIKVGAHVELSFTQAAWMGNVYPHLLTWNAELLEQVGHDIDFVSGHFYTPFDRVADADAFHRLVWSGPIVFEQNVAQLRRLLRQYARPDTEIAITEYGTLFGDETAPDPRIASTEGALFNAMMLFACMRAPDIPLANHWSLLNNSAFGMLRTTTDGKVERLPTFYVMRTLGAFARGRLLPVRITADTYAVSAIGNNPGLPRVPYLDAVAVRGAQNTLRVAVVNRAPRTVLDTSVVLPGIGKSTRVMAATWVPEDEEGRAWGPVHRRRLQRESDGVYACAFPPQSFTVLTVKRRSQQ